MGSDPNFAACLFVALVWVADGEAVRGFFASAGGSAKTIVRLEPERVMRLVDGRLEAFPARFEPDGTIVVNTFGVRRSWKAEPDEGGLWLTTERGRERLVRLDGAPPPEFDPKPMKLGKPRKLKPAEAKAIEADLLARESVDQAVRNDPAREAEMPKVDADNTAYLRKLVADLGWIDVARFGERAANAAWVLATHADDLPLQLAAIPEIEKDVTAKRLRDGQNLANLSDRVRLKLGYRQRYGTQVGQDASGEFVVLPLEDRKKVDELRKAIRMIPLAEDLEKQKSWTGGKEIRVQDEI